MPGFGETSARSIGSLGYRVCGWGLGRNNGNVPQLIPRVIERAASLAEQIGSAVNLVGWSLGGALSHEVARDRPDLVRRVITLGTPVIGGPRYTVAAGYYELQGFDLGEIEDYVDESEGSARRRAGGPPAEPWRRNRSQELRLPAWKPIRDRSLGRSRSCRD